MWLYDIQYLVADINNHTSKENLNWQISLMIGHGDTREISSLLLVSSFTSLSTTLIMKAFPPFFEKSGYWIGVACDVGDVLTFKVYDTSSRKLLN